MNPFDSAKCTPEALARITEVREAFKKLELVFKGLQALSMDSSVRFGLGGREMAIAMTNLEQSSMWAIKAISHYNVAEEPSQ